MHSIRQRLWWWLLAGLLLVLAASGYAAYRQARTETNALFDYQLQQTALALRNQNLLALAISSDSEVTGDLLIQIWDRSRGLLYVSQQQRELPFATQPGFTELTWRNEPWRLFTLLIGERIVQVAQPMQVRWRMSADIALRNLAPFLLLLPGMGLVVWFGVGTGLQPLDRLAADLQRRRPSEMEPVALEQLPAELRPLAHALNELLARLAQTLNDQQRFIADAAHELRTPLTAVRLQAELARRTATVEGRDQALQDLRAGLERADHLVQQLLVMARLDASPSAQLESVDLVALAKNVIGEQSAVADANALDLGLLTAEDSAILIGDSVELRALLDNLVDNALRYTPRGGRVDVGIRRSAAEIVLWVQDTGPGIPPEEWKRAFDRFYRGSGVKTAGSGLGLAIVKRIAHRHGARIALSAAKNDACFQITVCFPLVQTGG